MLISYRRTVLKKSTMYIDDCKQDTKKEDLVTTLAHCDVHFNNQQQQTGREYASFALATASKWGRWWRHRILIWFAIKPTGPISWSHWLGGLYVFEVYVVSSVTLCFLQQSPNYPAKHHFYFHKILAFKNIWNLWKFCNSLITICALDTWTILNINCYSLNLFKHMKVTKEEVD